MLSRSCLRAIPHLYDEFYLPDTLGRPVRRGFVEQFHRPARFAPVEATCKAPALFRDYANRCIMNLPSSAVDVLNNTQTTKLPENLRTRDMTGRRRPSQKFFFALPVSLGRVFGVWRIISDAAIDKR